MTLLGLWLAKKVDLGAPILQAWTEGKEIKPKIKNITKISIILGITAALLIILIDLIFTPTGLIDLNASLTTPAWWQGFLASF